MSDAASCSLPPDRRDASRLLLDGAKFLLLLTAMAWLLGRGSETLGYNWQWYQVPRHLAQLQDGRFIPGPLLDGLLVTLRITGQGLILAPCLGLAAALLLLSDSPVGRFLARAYVELIRNTPLLIQLFFAAFVMAPLLDLEAETAAVLSLSLFEGAYAAEIIRAGITSIDRGQWEAAESFGLTTWQAYRHVILPQALRRVLPPLAGQAVSLVKDSALVSTIAIHDLTMEGQIIVSRTFLAFEIWFAVAGLYLAVTFLLSFLVNRLDKRLRLV